MPSASDPTPGLYSTEWWSLMVSKLIALAGLIGIFTTGDVAGLQDAASKAIAAAAIVAAQALLVWGYIHKRIELKRLHLKQTQVSPNERTK